LFITATCELPVSGCVLHFHVLHVPVLHFQCPWTDMSHYMELLSPSLRLAPASSRFFMRTVQLLLAKAELHTKSAMYVCICWEAVSRPIGLTLVTNFRQKSNYPKQCFEIYRTVIDLCRPKTLQINKVLL